VTATVLAVFLVPVFFVSVRSLFGDRQKHEEPSQPPQSPPPSRQPASGN